jgi:peptide-methionine (S)-S-oxide reductase
MSESATPAPAPSLEKATLGGGCFWCLEAVYQEVRGVESVVSGYAGGHVADPDYRHVCTGTTGHAEIVQLRFDPAVVDYADLLRVFFTIHDPTTPDRQGYDTGPQYRSLIMTHTDEQARVARAVMDEVTEAGWYDDPLVTEVVGDGPVYVAEREHQNYFRTNPNQRYCQLVVAPKVAKWRSTYGDRLRRSA